MAVEQSDVIHMKPVMTLSRQSYCYYGMQQMETQIQIALHWVTKKVEPDPRLLVLHSSL